MHGDPESISDSLRFGFRHPAHHGTRATGMARVFGIPRQGQRSSSGGAGDGGRYRSGSSITEPSGNMVVDIGGGTTNIAVISLAGIVYSRSVRVAGNAMDDAVMLYLKRKYNLLIGELTAERIKVEIGSAFPLDKPASMEIKGRNLIEGVPKTITVGDAEIREALSECIATIINGIRVALERTPPELSADISDRGIVLTGGGALIKNLDKRIREETGLPVSIADDPLTSVVLGIGRMLSDFKLLRKISID